MVWLVLLITLLAGWDNADASGSFSCSSPCVQGYAGVGNGFLTSETMTITNAVAGHILVVTTRGGSVSTSASVNNVSGPATLTWTTLVTWGASDWVHTVHCAVVPTTGTYAITTSNNASGCINGFNCSDRSIVLEYNTGACTGALHNESRQANGTSLSSGNVSPTGSALLYSTIASDGDEGNHSSRTLTGGTIQNAVNCADVDVEPDQKLCAGDKGVVSAGTHSAVWTFTSVNETWSVIAVTLPTSTPDTTPPDVPTNLQVTEAF